MKSALLLAIFGALLAPVSFAQKESLLIGPGDQVHIDVFDTPELSSTARVDDHGDLPLLMGGNVHVAGLTPEQAGNEISGTLVHRKLMNKPQVLVTVQKSATQNVTVFGSVVKPSTIEITTPRPLAEVLAQSGGFTTDADHHVTIRRSATQKDETVFVSNDGKDNIAQNVYVYPGDMVTVPKQDVVYVLGDVNRAGGFPMNNDVSGMTVLQAVAQAGGTQHTAHPSGARLIRREHGDDYKEIPLDISAMQKGKKPDMKMEKNDIVYVPFGFWENAALGITGIAAAATSAVIYVK